MSESTAIAELGQTSLSLWRTGIYTLTATHCGTGQASGAIDLPIAREKHTQLPILPATTLKGVMRSWFSSHPENRREVLSDHGRNLQQEVRYLFGPEPSRTDENGRRVDDDAGLAAGALVFLDGLLLALPVRSLSGVFRMVTSPLLIERLCRVTRSTGEPYELPCPEPDDNEAFLPSGQVGPLSLEDRVWPTSQCRSDSRMDHLVSALQVYVSSHRDQWDRQQLAKRLVVVSDDTLQDLCLRATPVDARIVLNEQKVSENLWYEESLSPDCLFAALIARRPTVSEEEDPLQRLRAALSSLNLPVSDGGWITQIGGNATVGAGLCRWTMMSHHQDAQ